MYLFKSTFFSLTLAAFFSRSQTAEAAAGNVDPGFSGSMNGPVYSTAIQRDGKIIIGGGFTATGGGLRNGIARLNGNGDLDLGFNPNVNSEVLTTAIQGNGQIVIGGSFTLVCGEERNNVARLNPGGTLDPGFNPDVDNQVNSMVIEVSIHRVRRLCVWVFIGRSRTRTGRRMVMG